MEHPTDLTDEVIEAAVEEGDAMEAGDFVGFVERYHGDGPGVDRDVLAAYAERLDDLRDFRFDVEGFLETVDGNVTDSETWVGPDAFYELDDGRVSTYPQRWHKALGGSTDVVAYLRFFRDEAPGFVTDTAKSGAGSGVPEDTLLRVMAVLGGMDRAAARAELERARDEGAVVEDLDQHPQTDVYLAEGNEERGDQAVQSDR